MSAAVPGTEPGVAPQSGSPLFWPSKVSCLASCLAAGPDASAAADSGGGTGSE
jgi:hypothetical protein